MSGLSEQLKFASLKLCNNSSHQVNFITAAALLLIWPMYPNLSVKADHKTAKQAYHNRSNAPNIF